MLILDLRQDGDLTGPLSIRLWFEWENTANTAPWNEENIANETGDLD
jgi:hypothetical protein